jgi:hypothetical protein
VVAGRLDIGREEGKCRKVIIAHKTPCCLGTQGKQRVNLRKLILQNQARVPSPEKGSALMDASDFDLSNQIIKTTNSL